MLGIVGIHAQRYQFLALKWVVVSHRGRRLAAHTDAIVLGQHAWPEALGVPSAIPTMAGT